MLPLHFKMIYKDPLDALSDILNIGHGVFNSSLLRVEYDLVEVGVNDHSPQSLKLGDELQEQFFHETEQSLPQGRVIQLGQGRPQPSTGIR